MIEKIVILSAFVSFVVLLLTKTGLRDSMRDNADAAGLDLVAKAIDCDFCLCWWVALSSAIAISMATGTVKYLPLAILSTPIARILL